MREEDWKDVVTHGRHLAGRPTGSVHEPCFGPKYPLILRPTVGPRFYLTNLLKIVVNHFAYRLARARGGDYPSRIIRVRQVTGTAPRCGSVPNVTLVT
jgi:hypothetical protein